MDLWTFIVVLWGGLIMYSLFRIGDTLYDIQQALVQLFDSISVDE